MPATFTVQPHAIPGARHGRVKFPNGWSVSVVAGLPGSGLHGDLTARTCEVAVFRPNGIMLEEVLPNQSQEQVQAILSMVEML